MEKSEKLKIRDNILEGLLFYVAGNRGIREDLVLRGGNALHFVYASPRYSSDLDFAAEDFDNKKIAIHNELISPILWKYIENLILTYNKIDDNVIRTKYAFGIGEDEPFGRVEVLKDKSFDYKETEGKFNPLLVSTPQEIYADKVYSTLNRLATRGSFKGTDLFDLEYLANNLNAEANEEQVERKAKHYEYVGFDKKTVETLLKMINDPKLHKKYLKGIRTTMMPDYFEAQKFDKEYFEKCTRHFEKYKKILPQ